MSTIPCLALCSTLMAITHHGINQSDMGALVRCSLEGIVKILKGAAAVDGAMGTGAFDVMLDIDMLKDAILDHQLPVQTMLATQIEGGKTQGRLR